jgi:hypothetical protein
MNTHASSARPATTPADVALRIKPSEARSLRAAMVRSSGATIVRTWGRRAELRAADPVIVVAHTDDPVGRDLCPAGVRPGAVIVALLSAAALAVTLASVNPAQARTIAREGGRRPLVVAIGFWGTTVGTAGAFGLNLEAGEVRA